jgi:DNA invertase Pin-like site-specific DNA recombinase
MRVRSIPASRPKTRARRQPINSYSSESAPQAQNWSTVREYEDHESGGKSERAAFQQMLRDAAARRFDILFFWSLDRLTRERTLANN